MVSQSSSSSSPVTARRPPEIHGNEMIKKFPKIVNPKQLTNGKVFASYQSYKWLTTKYV